jgi:hypothetical protein
MFGLILVPWTPEIMSMNKCRADRMIALQFWTICLGLNVVLGTLIAVVAESRGCSRFGSIAMGAGYSVVGSWFVGYLYGSARCAVWRLTRGYPFVKGDIVTITSGPHRGDCGRVVTIGQAPWILGIELDKSNQITYFSVGELKRSATVSGGTEAK